MNIMISQPMGGKSDEEIKKDREVALEVIKNLGYTHVESLVDKIPPNTNNEALWCLGASLERISKSDGVLFIGNWIDYRGCRIEYLSCKEYGIKTFQLVGNNYLEEINNIQVIFSVKEHKK